MKLYPFQKELVDRFVDTPSVLVGDDMGLGKTFEALALDLRRRTTQLPGRQLEYPTLIVAPLSVLGVWEWHIKQLWPAARVAVINPKMRGKFIRELDSQYHYYIIHWEGVRLVEELQKRSWWHIVADEAHRMKNRKAQQTWALKKLHTNYKTALSGTPADNAPQDLWSLLNWLYPKRWTSYWSYERKHVKYQWHQAASQANGFKCPVPNCEDFHKSSFKKMVGVDYVDELHAEIAPYYMRRLKAEVISELPEKYYTQIEVDLAPKQRRIYDEMRHDMLAWIGEHEHEPIAAPIVVASSSGSSSSLWRTLSSKRCRFATGQRVKYKPRHASSFRSHLRSWTSSWINYKTTLLGSSSSLVSRSKLSTYLPPDSQGRTSVTWCSPAILHKLIVTTSWRSSKLGGLAPSWAPYMRVARELLSLQPTQSSSWIVLGTQVEIGRLRIDCIVSVNGTRYKSSTSLLETQSTEVDFNSST